MGKSIFEPREREQREFTEIILNHIARNSNYPRIQRMVKDFEKIEEIKMDVADDELLLGVVDRSFDDPVTMKYDGKVTGNIIFGKKGSGKTQFAKTFIIDQLHRRFGHYLLIIDPKLDYVCIDQPQDNQALIDTLKKFNLRPHAYSPAYCVPKFLQIRQAKGKQYVVGLQDFTAVDRASLSMTLHQFFRLKEGSAPSRSLYRIVNSKIPKSTKGMKTAIEEDYESQKQIISTGRPSTMLRNVFEEFMQAGLIGDKDRFSFPVELASNGIAVLQTTLYGETQRTLAVYVKLAIASLIADRTNYLTTKGAKGVLDRPIHVMIDEADVLAPKGSFGSPAKNIIQSLFTKQRMNGFSCSLITQNPAMLDNVSISQSDYIITSKLFSDEERHALKARGIPDYVIKDVFQRLEWKKDEPLKQHAIIYPDDEKGYDLFYPIPPLEAIMKESQMW